MRLMENLRMTSYVLYSREALRRGDLVSDQFVEILLAIMIIGIPGAALATRFVLRPMLREVSEAIRSTRQPGGPELDARMLELEEGQRLITEQLERLVEAERFRQELEVGKRAELPGAVD